MRKNVKRTIAVLSAVCMLPCPQVANVAVMAQNVSVGNSIGAKTLKQSLQTSTNFETASGKRQEVKENNIEDSYDITYGDSITFFVSKTKIPDQDQTDNSGNEDDQKQDDGQKDSETDVIPDYEVPDTINGFSFNKEETDDGYQLTFTANEAMRSAAIKIKGQDVVLKTKKRKLTAKASVKNKVYVERPMQNTSPLQVFKTCWIVMKISFISVIKIQPLKRKMLENNRFLQFLSIYQVTTMKLMISAD